MNKVKTLNYRLAEQYNAGKITLRQAAEQFYLHGWTNYIDLDYTIHQITKCT